MIDQEATAIVRPLYDAWLDIVNTGDESWYDKHLAPDFTATAHPFHGFGKYREKFVTEGRYLKRFQFDDLNVAAIRYGDVILSRIAGTLNDIHHDGLPEDQREPIATLEKQLLGQRLYYASAWRLTDGVWQCYNHHITVPSTEGNAGASSPRDRLTTAEFATLYDYWFDVAHKGDLAWFERRLTDDFTCTAHPFPEATMDRAQFIDAERDLSDLTAHVVDMMVVEDEPVALVHLICTLSGEVPDKDMPIPANVLNEVLSNKTVAYACAWRREGDVWKNFETHFLGPIA